MKKLFNITDLGISWGMTRGGSSKHYKKGNIDIQPSHYHGTEVFWESIPKKPKRKK